jgi:AraC-like DNA-binding protein
MSVPVALPSIYLQQFSHLLNELGGDFTACLRVADLTPEMLNEPMVKGDWKQVERFFSCALQQVNVPELGALLGERLLVQTHGALGYSLMNAPTLSEAFGLLESFIRIRIGFMRLRVENQSRLILTADIKLATLERFFSEVVCMAVKLALEFICHNKQVVQAVHFAFAEPESATTVRAMFACAVHYSQPQTALIIQPELLSSPIRIAEPEVFALAQKMCAEALAALSETDSFSYRVRRYILAATNRFPDQEEVCRQLHITTRTLHRNLAKEGTTYRQIMEDIKRGLAKEYLAKGQHSQQEMAYLLGYSDAANFRRALRRWML